MMASSVVELLRKKHADDVFAAEVKNGPTWNGSAMRLDAWAMRKSWANPCMTGYEIKVSRSDWLADKKWTEYLRLVNEFYLVAPDGVIRESEVPDGVGILRVSKNNARLFTARKAVWKEADQTAVVLLMQYVLQSRATIDAPRERKSAEGWKQWLANKEQNRGLGWLCSKALREKYERDVEQVRREIKAAQEDREFVRAVIEETNRLGIRWESGWRCQSTAQRLADSIEAAGRGCALQPHEMSQIRHVIPLLERLAAESKRRNP